MTPNEQSLVSALRQAQEAVSLAKLVRNSVNAALAQHVRSRIKANDLMAAVVCRRLGWGHTKLNNFLHLNYILNDADLAALLKAVEMPRALHEALRRPKKAKSISTPDNKTHP
jgi:hypothetical protein